MNPTVLEYLASIIVGVLWVVGWAAAATGVLIILTVVSERANAAGFEDTDAVVFHLACRHVDQSNDPNEINPGIGVRLGQGWGFLTAGAYHNSQYKTSIYAGAGKTFYSYGPMNFSVIAGAITGYDDAAMPLLLPEISWHAGDAAVVVNFIPSPGKSGVASVSVAFNF